MPSFDIESKVDQHELTNAIDQANRVIANRFDFKGTDSEILQNENKITSIQGDTVRISGKKRDDLQSIMAEIKSLDIELPLQFKNFRD